MNCFVMSIVQLKAVSTIALPDLVKHIYAQNLPGFKNLAGFLGVFYAIG